MSVPAWAGTITLHFGDYRRHRVNKYTAMVWGDEGLYSQEAAEAYVLDKAKRAGFDPKTLVETVVMSARKQPRTMTPVWGQWG